MSLWEGRESSSGGAPGEMRELEGWRNGGEQAHAEGRNDRNARIRVSLSTCRRRGWSGGFGYPQSRCQSRGLVGVYFSLSDTTFELGLN